jgi:hypothetical protein
MPHNLATLLDETTSPRAIGVKLNGCRKTKNIFCRFIYSNTRGGAIFLNPKMMHKLVKNGYSL